MTSIIDRIFAEFHQRRTDVRIIIMIHENVKWEEQGCAKEKEKEYRTILGDTHQKGRPKGRTDRSPFGKMVRKSKKNQKKLKKVEKSC